MLGRFCFELFGGVKVRQQREVNYYGVVGTQIPLYLAYGFDKGKGLNIANATTDFGDNKIVLARFTQQENVAFYFVGNVGNNLNCFSEVFPFAFFCNNVVVNAACSDVISLAGAHVKKTFVVAKVEIGFGAVVGNVAFAVLVVG